MRFRDVWFCIWWIFCFIVLIYNGFRICKDFIRQFSDDLVFGDIFTGLVGVCFVVFSLIGLKNLIWNIIYGDWD